MLAVEGVLRVHALSRNISQAETYVCPMCNQLEKTTIKLSCGNTLRYIVSAVCCVPFSKKRTHTYEDKETDMLENRTLVETPVPFATIIQAKLYLRILKTLK